MDDVRKILSWIFGGSLLLTGIFWMENNVLYSLLCIIVSIAMLPITQTLFEKAKKIKLSKYISWLLIVSGVFLIFNSIFLIYKADKKSAKANLELANEYINKRQFDTVPFLLSKSDKYGINEELKVEFNIYNDSLYVRSILANMTDEEYELLQNKELDKKYLEQETLNEIFYENLHEISSQRNLIIKQIKKEKKRKEKKK